MAELLEVIDTLRAQDADVQRLFGKSDGEGVHARAAHRSGKLAEAAKFVGEVFQGKRPAHHLREAMTTSDFPYLFGDIIDRIMYGAYAETPQVYRNFARVATVQDFRTVKRFALNGGEGVLPAVAEQAEYPAGSVSDARYSYSVKKYGRRMPFSWEAIINDDLGALQDIPVRMGRAARRSESKFVTDLYCGTTGPDGTFFASGNANIVTSNPGLSITALQTAFKILAAQTDADGEPIVIEAVRLVVPPALEVTAQNILNATQLWLDTNASAGTAQQNMVTQNWMARRVGLDVDPYIPIIASSSNGSTSWFLFASPSAGRPAIEVGFLRGHESPEVFIKAPNASRVGGGLDAMNGDFDTDSIEYKVRHIFGGTMVDPKMAVASNGSGS